MINIIEFIGSLSDGGAETLVRNYALLLNGLKHNGDEIKITILTIMPVNGTANNTCLKESGISVVSIYKHYNLLTRILKKCFGRFYIAYSIKRICKFLKPDVIHVHLQILHYLLPISSYLKNVKIVYTCHSEPNYQIGKYHKDENRAVNKLLKNNRFQIIALHDEMRKEINSMFRIENTVVVHNGIDLNRFNGAMESRSTIRHSLGIPENAFVVGHVGRFSPPKNHSFLIDVFAEVLKVKPNAYLLLVGSGPLLDNVRRILREKDLEGYYTILSHRRDIPELLKAMDVFLFPSLFEGMPVALIEAQAANLRCVKSTRVTNDSIITPIVQSIPLESSLTVWRDAVLADNYIGTPVLSKELFSDQNMVKELLSIYLKQEEN